MIMRPDGVRVYDVKLSPRAATLKSIAANDRGIKEAKKPKYKMAAGTEVVKALFNDADIDPGIKAACVCCFFALLRRSEASLCYNATTRRRDCRLTRRHLRVRKTETGRYLELFIVGKGNVNNAGRTRIIGEVRGSWADPVSVVDEHIRRTRDLVGAHGAAFVLEFARGRRAAGSPVTGDDIGQAVKRGARAVGLKPELYAAHSLRIGGASALAAAGMSDWQLMVLGRWTSWTFLRYLRMDLESIVAAAARMAATNVRGVIRA